MVDLLTLIAELSVALAGFTAVFSILDARHSKDGRETGLQIMRVKQMLIGAVITALACVVAVALLQTDVRAATVWRISGGGALVALVATVFALSREGLGGQLTKAPGFSRLHATLVFTLLGLSIVLLVCTVLAAEAPCAPGLFVAAAITLFAFSCIQFARAAIKQFAAARSDRPPDGAA